MELLAGSIPGAVSLGQGIPFLPTPGHIAEAAHRAIKAGLADRYTLAPGLLELREEICKKLAKVNNIRAEPDEILVTVGASEALVIAVLALIKPGDEVLLPSPCYPSHVQAILLAGARPVFVPLIEDEGWRLVSTEFRKLVTRNTKAILLCSPQNPTGAVFVEEDIRALADVAREHSMWVITDEAYESLTYDDVRHFSPASIPEMAGRVVSCFSLSKTYAMTGWRIGYVAAPIRAVANMVTVHDVIAICAPALSQYVALSALAGPQESIEAARHELSQRRGVLCEGLDRLALFQYQKPHGAYYVFPRITGECIDSVEFSVRLLREAKVMTVPGRGFGPTGESHLRLSFAGTEDAIKEACDRLESWCSGNPFHTARDA